MIQKIDSSYPLVPLYNYCLKSLDDKRPNAVNMDPIDWENKPHTFLYLLYKEKRFDGPKSGYLLYYKQGEIVAGTGWYPSDWDDNMFVQTRAYVTPGHLKNLSTKNAILTNDLMFYIEDCAIKQGYKGGIVSVEKYNKHIIDLGLKLNNPSRYPLYRKEEKDGIILKEWREPCVRMREGFYAGLYNIRNTEQHVYYQLFDKGYKDQFLEKIRCLKV